MGSQKYYAYSFTILRLGRKETSELLSKLKRKVKYCVLGREISPKSGVEHIQGYLYLRSPSNFVYVQKLIGYNAYISYSRESPMTNYLYCTKDGDYIETGSIQEAEEHYQMLKTLEKNKKKS